MNFIRSKSIAPAVGSLVLALGATIIATGCGQGDATPISAARAGAATLESEGGGSPVELASVEPADLGAARPAHSVGSLYLAGLPNAADFPAWKQQGVETVVTLLTDREIDWDEGAAVSAAGMKFVQIPFGSDDAVFDRTRALLRENNDRPLVLHCKSSNRVGAVWLTHRVLDEGADLERALAEAKETGLRSSRLEQQALDYIRRQRESAASEASEGQATESSSAPHVGVPGQ